MTNKRSWFLFVMIFFIALLPLCAQDDTTIEEEYLQKSMMVQMIESSAYSEDRDMKMIALSDINDMVNDGDLSEDSIEVIRVLFDLGQEGVGRTVREQNKIINDFPMVRREACKLLGELGGEDSRKYLSVILQSDPDPMVQAEAIVAMAKCDVTGDARAQRAMAAAMYKQRFAPERSNNFAIAFLNAIQITIEEYGALTDPLVIDEVNIISSPSSGYRKIVQVRAREVRRIIIKNASENGK